MPDQAARARKLSLLIIWWLCLWLTAGSTTALGQEPAVRLTAESGTSRLAGKFYYLEDESGELGIADVTSPSVAARFQRVDADNISLGYTRSAVWLRFILSDTADAGRLLQLDYPLLDRIDVFEATGQGWREITMGDDYPFDQRPITHRTFVAPIHPRPEATQYFVRISSKSSMQVRPILRTTTSFYETEMSRELVFGLMYGVMLLMAIYNLFLFASVRDVAYLVYIFSVLSGGVFLMALNGHAYQFLWPESPSWANQVIAVSSSLWIVGTTAFTQVSLKPKRYAPLLGSMMQITLYLAVGAVVLALFADYRVAIQFGTALASLAGLLILITCATCWARGNRSARFFTLAWVVYALGTLMLVVSRFGIVPDNFFTHHSAAIGILLEIVILSFALSDKYRILNNELEVHALDLESKVNERTLELAEANQKLKKLSEQDPLTGLHNRRRFDAGLNAEWQRHLRQKDPLALLLCDIDEFKALNDHFGHDRGDECLKLVGRVIAEAARRPGDVAARIGGDEFAVILPQTPLQGAMEIAQSVCDKLRQHGFAQSPGMTHEVATASVGVASMVPASDDGGKELFRLADQAAYEAKRAGMGQVASLQG